MKILGADLLHVEFMDYLRGNLTAVPQDETQVTYASKIEKSEARLLWSKSAAELHNQVRGLAMGPSAFCYRADKPLKIWRTRVASEVDRKGEALQPGQVTQVLPGSFFVQCGDGVLEILELQPDSRPRMTAQSYLLGYSLSVGEMLS